VEVLLDMTQFHYIGSQEFTAGGQALEQPSYPDGGSRIGRCLDHILQFTVVYLHSEGNFQISVSGKQTEVRYSGYRRQSFSSEAQRTNVDDVVNIANLAGGVAFEGQHGVIRFHAHTVVDHLDEVFPPILHYYRDGIRSGIDTVFHQLFYYRSRAFYHFARSDFITDIFRKDIDLRHISI
jgi:hypothetical protein